MNHYTLCAPIPDGDQFWQIKAKEKYMNQVTLGSKFGWKVVMDMSDIVQNAEVEADGSITLYDNRRKVIAQIIPGEDWKAGE